MKLVFSELATPEQRAAVAAALDRRGVQTTAADRALVLDGALTRDAAVEMAAFPGVEEIVPAEGGQTTVRDSILEWVAGAAAVLGVLVLLAANFPAPLGAAADPLRTPGELRPSWPLLAWYSAVDMAPAWVPVPFLFLLAVVALFLWPLIGRRVAERSPWVHTAIGLAALLTAAALTARELVR